MFVVPVTSEGSYSPRYNVRKPESGVTIYEIALPGLTKEDVEVTLDSGILSISYDHEPKNRQEYVINSASVLPFRLRFMSRGSRVTSASMANGLLSIRLEAKSDVTRVAID